jgi:hypothetical protein
MNDNDLAKDQINCQRCRRLFTRFGNQQFCPHCSDVRELKEVLTYGLISLLVGALVIILFVFYYKFYLK